MKTVRFTVITSEILGTKIMTSPGIAISGIVIIASVS